MILVWLNNRRAAAGGAKTNDEMVEVFLEQIFQTSKHFSEIALTEYNAVAGSRTMS